MCLDTSNQPTIWQSGPLAMAILGNFSIRYLEVNSVLVWHPGNASNVQGSFCTLVFHRRHIDLLRRCVPHRNRMAATAPGIKSP